MVKNKKRKSTGPTPRFSRRKSKFYCPESPSILWHHGLIYAECPFNEENRDMEECENCSLRGKAKFKGGKNKKRRYKKDISKLERRNKEQIPKIGKTYSS